MTFRLERSGASGCQARQQSERKRERERESVCVSVCLYLCMHVLYFLYVRMYVYVCVYVYVYVHLHVCKYVCMHALTDVCMCLYLCLYVPVCACICMYVYVYVYMYVCMYVCVCVCLCMHVLCVCARVFFVSLFVCLLVDLIDCLLVCVCVVYTCLWLRSRLPVFECMDPSVTRSLRNLHGFARHLATFSEEVLRGFHNSKGFDPEVLFRSRRGDPHEGPSSASVVVASFARHPEQPVEELRPSVVPLPYSSGHRFSVFVLCSVLHKISQQLDSTYPREE